MRKLFLIVALMAAMALEAVPAYPGLMPREQPNGYSLRTYLRGDERKHWIMTEDGWEIAKTDKGWYKYVKQNRKGEKKISCRKAKNAEDRSRHQQRWLEKHGVKKH